jgi:hypothetical protein
MKMHTNRKLFDLCKNMHTSIFNAKNFKTKSNFKIEYNVLSLSIEEIKTRLFSSHKTLLALLRFGRQSYHFQTAERPENTIITFWLAFNYALSIELEIGTRFVDYFNVVIIHLMFMFWKQTEFLFF